MNTIDTINNIYNTIIEHITNPNIDLVYMAVGSANNALQQFPPFLNKFIDRGQIVSILIDPYFESKPLFLKDHSTLNFRLVKKMDQCILYQSTKFDVFVLKTPFYYEHAQFVNHSLDNPSKLVDTLAINAHADVDIAFLINIIQTCLCKVNPTKFILQDYTGRDIFPIFVNMINIFGLESNICQHVLFDVTQGDGGCFAQLTEDQARVNSSNHFVQEKFSRLEAITQTPSFIANLSERINIFLYPLTWNYYNFVIQNNLDFEHIGLDKIKLYCAIYQIVFNPNDLANTFDSLINVMLDDIVRSNTKNNSLELVDNILRLLGNRSDLIREIGLLRP